MTTLYVVEKVGVYRQGIIIIKETEQEAREALEQYLSTKMERINQDGDGYHTFELSKLSTDEPLPLLICTYASERTLWRGPVNYMWSKR